MGGDWVTVDIYKDSGSLWIRNMIWRRVEKLRAKVELQTSHITEFFPASWHNCATQCISQWKSLCPNWMDAAEMQLSVERDGQRCLADGSFGSFTAQAVLSLVWCKLARFSVEAHMANIDAWHVFLNCFPHNLPYFCLCYLFLILTLVHTQWDVCIVSQRDWMMPCPEHSDTSCHPKSHAAGQPGAAVCKVRYSGADFPTHNF